MYHIDMNSKVKTIIEQLKSKYASFDTILLFGSALDDDWTSSSDIDLFLIDDNLTEDREDIIVDDISVEIQKDNFTNLAKDIEAERGALLNRNLSTMIANSTTIVTKSEAKLNDIKTLAQSVLESKTIYTDEDIKMWRYSINDYLQKAEKDLMRNDPLAFYLDTHYVIKNALELSLATHGVYLPQPKRLFNLLKTIDPSLFQVFQEFLSATDPHQKLTILKQLNQF